MCNFIHNIAFEVQYEIPILARSFKDTYKFQIFINFPQNVNNQNCVIDDSLFVCLFFKVRLEKLIYWVFEIYNRHLEHFVPNFVSGKRGSEGGVE